MSDTFTVGMSERGEALLRSGQAVRDGGVLRGKGGEIIEFLHDADGLRLPELAKSLVPVAVQGVAMIALDRRLQRIERELRVLCGAVAEVADGVERANVKLDSVMFGQLVGTLQACELDLAEGRVGRLAVYRHHFLMAHRSLGRVAEELCAPARFRSRPSEVAWYIQAWAIPGIAARDVCLRLDEPDSAMVLTEQLRRDAERMSGAIDATLMDMSALCWFAPKHLACQSVASEVKARLRGHAELLRAAGGRSLLPMARPLAE